MAHRVYEMFRAVGWDNEEARERQLAINKAKEEKGGGFYVLPYHQHTFSDVLVRNTVVRSNEAKGNGGGAFVSSAATTTFSDYLADLLSSPTEIISSF